MAYLAEQGPASVSEVVKETNLGEEKVKLILRGLMQNGYVQAVTQD